MKTTKKLTTKQVKKLIKGMIYTFYNYNFSPRELESVFGLKENKDLIEFMDEFKSYNITTCYKMYNIFLYNKNLCIKEDKKQNPCIRNRIRYTKDIY